MRPRLRARPDEHQAARPLLADPKDINLSALNAIIQAACAHRMPEWGLWSDPWCTATAAS